MEKGVGDMKVGVGDMKVEVSNAMKICDEMSEVCEVNSCNSSELLPPLYAVGRQVGGYGEVVRWCGDRGRRYEGRGKQRDEHM